VPANPKLLGYWDVVADRLHKVRHCQNIEGLERALALFAPPIDPGALVRAAAAGTGGGAALRGLPIRAPHYRFRVLSDRAFAAANQVRLLGRTFTNALVARDREALAELVAGQDVAMTEGTRSLLRLQRDDAESALAALEQTRRSAEAAKAFVDARQDETALEAAAFGLETAGVVVKGVSAALSQVAGFVGTTPEFTTGASGIASPVVTVSFGGDNLHKALDGIATGLSTTADVLSSTGGLVANRADLERRKAAFAEDKRQAAIELARVVEEIEGARTRVAIAVDNIATLEAQIVNSRRVREHLRTRFTDEELWTWMVGRASEVFFQSYSVALDLARRAERAFQIELGSDDTFVSVSNWDSLRKGLLSGEGLLADLTTMNAAYLDRDRRTHEMRLQISLGELGGVDALRDAGKVELRIPEAELDRRTPGHFRRRVKSVAVTVQGRNGTLDLPAKLTLLRGTTRVRTDLADGYRRNERLDDGRFVDEFGVSSIVTSGRSEDTGLFTRDYDDDRYLPFEGAGLADSVWELDLFADAGADLSAVADVELVIDYSALDGGAALRQAAVAALR
jgi:hypothetical protein